MRTLRLLFFGVLVLSPLFLVFSQERTLLDERFYSNTNSWPEYENDNNSCRVYNGYYEANVKAAEGTWLGSIVLPMDAHGDYTFDASMTWTSGADNYGYGLVWGSTDVNNFFYFNVSGNGNFIYGKCENGKYNDIIPWTLSSAIHTTTGNVEATNRLTVRKVGTQLSLYINDTYVSQTAALPFFGSKIGFVVFRKMNVKFTSLRVTQSSSVSGGTILLHDDFASNVNGWVVEDNENHSASIANGVMTLQGKLTDKAFFECVPVSLSQESDYTIEASIREVSGPEDSGFGVAWGYSDGSNTLMFKISGNGYYQIVKRVSGYDTDLIPWEKTDAVVHMGGTNKLTLKKTGNELNVYVNDQFMKSIVPPAFLGGKVGFVLDRTITLEVQKLMVRTGSQGVVATGNEQTLLDEEFQNNANQWDENSDADLTEQIQNGRYVIDEHRPTGSRLSTIPLSIDESKDFTIESTFNKISGVENNGFGVVWGLKDAQNFYRVLITGNGHYLYGKSVNGVYQEAVDWTSTDAINEYNARNKITVKKSGSSVSVFINDRYINTFPFESFFGNNVGFVNHHTKRIEIENLIVRQSTPQVSSLPLTTADGTIILQDDFTTNANEWYEADNEMVKLKREYGKYVFEHKRTIGGYLTWMPTSLNANADFTITTSIKKVSGVDNYGYGLLWGVENNKNYYYFLISANGSYIYGKTVDGTSTPISQWTESSAIKQDGSLNKLTVKKAEDKLLLSINDQLQQTFPFDGSFGNYVGFKIDNNIGIEINNIVVTQGTGGTTYTQKTVKKDTDPPVITILEPQVSRGMKQTIKEKTILVRGKATDESGVFDVLVNDEEANIAENGEFQAEVKLKVGENTIVVRASDTKNNVGEQRFTIVRESEPLLQTSKPEESSDIHGGTFYALLIGVQDYADKSVNQLDHPISDAQQLMKVLTQYYTFEQKNVILLKDPDRKSVIRSFNDLRSKLKENDNLFIFYAGHGYWDPDVKQGYWLPSDATANDQSDWISNGTIRDYIRGIKAKHVLLVADACFSGGIFKTREAFSHVDLSIQKTYEMTSRRAISSGALKTVPDRSVFVEYLLKRLQENKDKFLLAEKLYINMKEAVINNSPNNQTPLYGVIGEAGDEGGDFIFVRKK